MDLYDGGLLRGSEESFQLIMISLALRRHGVGVPRILLLQDKHRHVNCNVRRFAATLSGSSYQYTKRSCFCVLQPTTSWSWSRRLITSRCIYRRRLRQSSYQSAHYFSTGREDEPSIRLLVNTAEEELPEIYATPTALLMKTHINNVKFISHEPIIMNNEQWYTATCEFGTMKRKFHSGKFGSLITTFEKNKMWKCDETLIVNGKVYYQSEDVAKEAASATG